MIRSRCDRGGLSLAMFAGIGLALAACGSSSPNPSGTGGHTGIGGALGTDGGVGVGGHTGVGGSTGVGGAGGTISPACSMPAYTNAWTFGAIYDPWVVATNSMPSTLAPVAGVDGGPDTGTKVDLDHTDGFPVTPPPLGSVKLTIPFDSNNEVLLFAQNSTSLNMAGATVTAYIKLDSGLNTSPANAGQAFLILKSTTGYVYAPGPITNLDSSAGWVQLSINVNTPSTPIPAGYDPCDIREIDVAIRTGALGTYTTAIVHIDTIEVKGPASDAGTDAADALPDATATSDAADAPVSADAADAGASSDAALPDGGTN
jgi:hypothetical protein